MSLDPKQIRKDFPRYNDHDSLYEGMPLVYLDNSATTFKPYSVIEAENDYYKNFTANTRRGDYSLAHQADRAFDNARKTIARFINSDFEETCFTSGDTRGRNEIAYGLLSLFNPGD